MGVEPVCGEECEVCEEEYICDEGCCTCEGHDYGTPVIVDATCTTAGSKTETCETCGDKKVTEIPALGHKYSDDEPECGEECKVCDEKFTCEEGCCTCEGHDLGAPVVVGATCTTDGTSTESCANCDYEEVTNIPALGHKYEGETPYCGEECEVCEEEFVCEDCCNCNRHSIAETCAPNQKCTECDAPIDSLPHETIIPATCEDPEICDDCKSITGPALGHKYEGETPYCGEECEVCEEELKCGICEICGRCPECDLVTVTIDPTCEVDGSITVTCKDCDYEDVTVLGKLGHDIIDTTVLQGATCVATGTMNTKCQREDCEHTSTRVIAIDENAHDMPSEWAVHTSATCVAAGKERKTCLHGCGHYEERDSAKDHLNCVEDWDEWVTKTVATCSAKEVQHRFCLCGREDTREYGEADPDNHNWVKTDTTPAKCEDDEIEHWECSWCLETDDRDIEDTALGHDDSGHPATCTSPQLCAVCSEEIAPILEHIWVKKGTTSATCVDDAIDHYECSLCEDTDNRNVEGSALGHDHTGPDATCINQKTCKVCQEELEPVDPDAHRSSVPVTCEDAVTCLDCFTEITPGGICTPGAAATCTTLQTCTECTREINPVNPTAHNPGPAATCTTAQTCTLCHVELAQIIPHDTTTVTINATCTEDGSITVSCKHCAYEDVTAITKLGHGEMLDTTLEHASTCVATGIMNTKCERDCGHTSTRVVGLDANAHGAMVDTTLAQAATCVATGTMNTKCEYECGHVGTRAIAINENAHGDMIDTTTAQAATCVATGTMNTKCERDGCTHTGTRVIEIDEDAHNPGAVATCIAPQTCTLCTTQLNPINANNHDTSGAAATCITDKICARNDCSHIVTPRLGHDHEGVACSGQCKRTGCTAVFSICVKQPCECIKSGANGTWDGKANASTGFQITVEGDVTDFLNLRITVNGVTTTLVKDQHYTVAPSNSFVITIKETYLSTLSSGEYTIAIETASGVIQTGLTIIAAGTGTPPTALRNILYGVSGILFVLGVFFIVMSVMVSRKKPTNP